MPIHAVDARPHSNSNFLVDLGYGEASSSGAGFCEVIFPDFQLGTVAPHTEAKLAPSISPELQPLANNTKTLILRRGFTGSRDLYQWWDKARRGKAPQQRTVKISLLAADHTSVVCSWYFRRVKPVRLSYSPLNALQTSVLFESIELSFDTMEMR